MMRVIAARRWWLLVVVVLILFAALGIATHSYVKADSLDQVNQEKAAKEAELDKVFKEIDRIRNSSESLSQKIADLKKEVAHLDELTKSLSKDLDTIDQAYAAEADKLDAAINRLQAKRVDLYIHSQRSLPQIMLSSGSFSDFMKTLLYEQFIYTTLVEENKTLTQQVIQQEEVLRQTNQNKEELQAKLTVAKNKLADLQSEQQSLNASLGAQYRQQSSLTQEIATLSKQAQSIIDKKAASSGNPGSNGTGNTGGNTVTPQDTPGDYTLQVQAAGINKKVVGPVRIVSTSGYITSTNNSSLTGNVHKYHGTLEFRHDSNVIVINELPLETYLFGLGEMPSSWHIEALKAQATAARTYAVANWGKREMYKYNLRDDVNDQNYEGYTKESSGGNWVPAVQQTTSKVAKSGSSYISTYYHSTCGGHTLASADVWGGNLSYAQAESDRFLKNGVWTSYEETVGASRARWKAGSYTDTQSYMQDFVDVAIYLAANNNSTSAQNKVACTINTLNQSSGYCGLNGATVYTSAQLQSVLGANSIEAKVGTISAIQHIYNDGGINIGQKSKFTQQLKITGNKGSLTIDGQVFKLAYNLRAPGDNWLASTLYDVQKSGGNWQMMSRGWGHRVGMCQYGAYGRAMAGQKYDEILKAYYQGISIADYAPSKPIRIGLTKAGGATNYLTSSAGVTIYDKNGLVGNAPAGALIRVK